MNKKAKKTASTSLNNGKKSPALSVQTGSKKNDDSTSGEEESKSDEVTAKEKKDNNPRLVNFKPMEDFYLFKAVVNIS